MVYTKHCCYGTCNSDTRYADRPHMQGVWFLLFPKPITQPEKCDRWIRACGRPRDTFHREKITRSTFLCSKHFVGGNGPTEEHPDPIPATTACPEQLETFSKVRLKSRKLRDHPLQSKSSYAQQLGLDNVNCPTVIDDMASFLEIAQNLVIGDDSMRAEQTIGARVGPGRIILSSIQLDHPYYTLSAGEDVGTADFSICYTSKKPITKTVGTQTEGECFCRDVEKHSARAKSMYEKMVLQSDIKTYIGKNQVQPWCKPSKRRKNVLEVSDSENYEEDVVKPSLKGSKRRRKGRKAPSAPAYSPKRVVLPELRTEKAGSETDSALEGPEDVDDEYVPDRDPSTMGILSPSSNVDIEGTDSKRAQGSIGPIPAWLKNQSVTADAVQAMITGLGIEILGVLCARAQPTTARVELCSLAAQTFTPSMYAELCRFMESCSAPQSSEQLNMPGFRKDAEELGGSAGVLQIKVEEEVSGREEKMDLENDTCFLWSASTKRT